MKELARATPQTAREVAAEAPIMSDGETRSPPTPYAQTLHDQGISRQAASRFQAVAEIPEADFEEALSGPEKPTTSGLLKLKSKGDEARRTSMPKISIEGAVSNAGNTYWDLRR